MGNNQSNAYDYQDEPYPNFDNYSQFEIYKIQIPSDLVTYYYDWYDDRLERNTRFIRIIDFNAQAKGCDACSTSESLTVYTQRVFFLDQLSLSYPEALFFLKQCLITLDQLYDQFGAFQVTPRMFGVNHKGKVKVWCNQNFAENLPEHQENPSLDEEDIVYDLVDMIQEATEDYRFTKIIESYAGSLTFSNTIRILTSMQAQEGLVVNKIFLDLKEYQAQMNRAIQAKNNALQSVVQTTYYETPRMPQQTYEIYEYPEVYIPHQVVNVPQVQYHQFANPAPAQYPTYSQTDPYTQNMYSVLKLYQPPTQHQQIQRYQPAQVHGINRVNKQLRVSAPEKMRSPQMNVVNRPIVQKLPVTQVDLKRLQADIKRKQNQMKLKKKLQDNYNQIPQVQSMIVVVQQEDRMKKHLDKISVPKGPSRQNYGSKPQMRNQQIPNQKAQIKNHQVHNGRPTNIQKQPMNIKQMNHQSEIFTLF